MQKNNTSPHILSTASNLLGLCFIVLTALKIQDAREATMIDEFTILAIILFMMSCILSFLSLRIADAKISNRFESVADYVFFIGLLTMFVTTLLAAFDYIQ